MDAGQKIIMFALKFSDNSDEIYNRSKLTLLKYAFQGGNNMVNGFSGIFMVASVAAVTGVSKTRRDERREPSSELKKKNAEKLFSSILEERTQENKADVVDCRTTTYGRDSKMQSFLYQTKEYRY